MMTMMMAQMNAAAVAAAAAAIGRYSSIDPSVIQNGQQFYPGQLSNDTAMDQRNAAHLNPHPNPANPEYKHNVKLEPTSDSDAEDESESFSTNGDDESDVRRKISDAAAGTLGHVDMAGMKVCQKICRVCGDKALGYNFNVVTCESCKAFFRRNALKKKEFRCPFNENCEVTAVSRRFCQKCRLRKCFEVGMKKEWIMSEEARMQKRHRIHENRRKRGLASDDPQVNPESNQANDNDHASPPVKKQSLSQEPLTNVGFSPVRNCTTPPAFGTGGAFSPPDSNGSAKSSVSPNGQQKNDHPETITLKGDARELARKISQHSMSLHLPTSTHASSVPNSIISINQDQSLSDQSAINAKMGCHPLNFGLGHVIKSDFDDPVTIPKAVLMALINQCHSEPYNHPSGPIPIISRAEQLIRNGYSQNELTAQCVCSCTCGAKCKDTRIGVKLVDKCVGYEPDDHQNDQSIKREYSTNDQAFKWNAFEFSRIQNTGSLNALENWKLKELYAANRIMIDPPDRHEGGDLRMIEHARQQSIVDHAGSGVVSGTIHLTDICVRRIIKMCKRISAFSSLCQDDQIALLKGGCTELMLLRGVMTFVPEKESWRPVGCKDTLLSLEILKGVKGNVYDEHRKFLHSFREEWRRSDAIMLTLAAITLFNPRRPNLIHTHTVQMEQESYFELLKHYLDTVYGSCTLASSEAFRELLLRVQDVGRLNDYAATIFLEVNPTDVEPLLIEIFDLK